MERFKKFFRETKESWLKIWKKKNEKKAGRGELKQRVAYSFLLLPYQ